MPLSKIVQNSVDTPVAGTGPAFSAYANAVQSVTSGVPTKVQFSVEDFDTASAYDNTTNFRFQPLVAGYYQCNAAVRLNGVSSTNYDIYFFKNGSNYRNYSTVSLATGIGTTTIQTISALIFLNGSTDYLEVWADVNGSSTTFSAASGNLNTSSFSGSLVRAA